MQAIIAELVEKRAELLAELDAIPSRLVGSEKWNDRVGELAYIRRRLVALGVE